MAQADRDHKLTVVLADQTRYRIYRAIAEQAGTPVTVAEVAARFGLHPNVARMHLGKLEQAGFVTTGVRRSQGGGRPAKLYSLSDKVSSFGFPPRRYELLSTLALAVLADQDGSAQVERVCNEAGMAEGRRWLHEEGDGKPLTRAKAAAAVQTVAEEQGLFPVIAWHGDELQIEVHNCVFRELSGMRPDLVCAMHRAFLAGLVSVVMASFGGTSFAAAGRSISRGAESCRLAWTFRR
jgi:predicted ArsR family transcriptional regulator